MISTWLVIGLILATVGVATLGAMFSIVGIGALFSGALASVGAMATALEFAKFVLAAYLHQRWQQLNLLFKSYLVFAVVVLSAVTSMGIYGFLSDAYSSASTVLVAENIKLESYKKQLAQNRDELARLEKMIDEIPVNRVSRRLQMRSEQEPIINDLNTRAAEIERSITAVNLSVLEVEKKVGPLIYISRAFGWDIDDVVKYLILILVCVFDPLAICLVIASTEALASRRQQKSAAVSSATASTGPAPAHDDTEVIEMRFSEEKSKSAV